MTNVNARSLADYLEASAARFPERPAVVGPDERTLTYAELDANAGRVAAFLASVGVQPGDRVALLLPKSVETVTAIWGILKAGAVYVPIDWNSPAERAQSIMTDCDTRAVFVDAAVAATVEGCDPPRKNVIVLGKKADSPAAAPGWVRWEDIFASDAPAVSREGRSRDQLAYILYTSGSTGKPKGVQHSTGGYLLHAALTTKWTFDLKDNDVFWCTADIGWVTGHTYITYGPLALGGTEIVFEGVPTYPDAGRFWKMIQYHKVSIFYTAPTAIRSLIKAAEANDAVHPKSYDLSSLRLLGSVGEPINPAAWEWYYKHVGGSRCPIVDTFWQTETGGHMITPLPGVTPMVPGSCTLPFPGIQAAVVDEAGHDMPNGQGGILVVKRPWPSMIRTIWGDPERFVKSYYPDEFKGKYYLAGDGAIRDEKTGYFTITGRIDDVLNVSGHRMGTMEIESALVSCTELVAEAAVVGRPDDTTGEAICAFVVLKRPRPVGDEAKAIAKILRDHVGKEIGPIAKPKDIRFGDNLPKTRSGKIMRRLLRDISEGRELGNISTLADPAVVEAIRAKFNAPKA